MCCIAIFDLSSRLYTLFRVNISKKTPVCKSRLKTGYADEIIVQFLWQWTEEFNRGWVKFQDLLINLVVFCSKPRFLDNFFSFCPHIVIVSVFLTNKRMYCIHHSVRLFVFPVLADNFRMNASRSRKLPISWFLVLPASWGVVSCWVNPVGSLSWPNTAEETNLVWVWFWLLVLVVRIFV